MITNVPDETQHVADGPVQRTAKPESTEHVADGPVQRSASSPSETAGATPGALRGPSKSGSPDLPRFGRYKTTAKLGEGGMGEVYRAHDDVLGRDVAIKVLTSDGDLGIRERFTREARAIGAVIHPNGHTRHVVITGEEAR
jgi:serine/threonine protein kinase